MSVPKKRTPAVGDHGDVLIRRARLDDLSRVQELDAEVFKDLAYQAFTLRQLFDLHAPGWVLAEQGAALVGYSLIAPDFDRSTAWLLALGVRSDCRRKKIGARLLERSLESLQSVDVKHVTLTVDPGNEHAITLYKKTGFLVKELQQDYLGPGEDRLLMRLDLAAR
ncbi:MAG: GNAT family N-acetyltransferase [Kibdelosporangium sp.]